MDWNPMSDFKKALLLSLPFALFAAGVSANEDTGRYLFAKYRYFGAKLATDNYYHVADSDNNSAHRFYPNMDKHRFNYLKNMARTLKDAISYGDWNKPYRIMAGFEADEKRNKSSKSNYGYTDKSGSLFLLADKAYYNNYLRFGGAVVLTKYDSDYVNSLHQKEDIFQTAVYGIYNDVANQIRWRSRAYLGYGASKTERRSQNGSYDDKSENMYYGFENSFSKTFQSGIFYFQPQVEFNGLGVRRSAVNDGMYRMPENDSMMWYGLADLYFGIKGRDAYDNSYNIKIGPEFTRVFSDPYDGFYALAPDDILYFKERRDKRDYVTWKAYVNYTLPNGIGFYGDFRYYVKDADSTAFAFGVDYRF